MTEIKLIEATDLEAQIFMFEEVRIVFRVNPSLPMKPYPFKSAVGDSNSLQLLHDRIEKTYPGIPFSIIDGEGLCPGLRLKKLKEVRLSYIK